MSIPPKKTKLVMDKKGIHYKNTSLHYPVKLGKLKQYRSVFKNVTVELLRKGNSYYLNFFDPHKGLIGVGRISKLDAYNLIRSRLSKLGYDDTIQIGENEFNRLVRQMDFRFID